MKKILIIFLLLSIGLFLRVWQIDKSPNSIGFDEAGLGYNAYSLMMTGKDEHGLSWPVSLKSFGDYKPALYSYLTIPFIKIFGLNNLSLRLVSALSGVFLSLAIYFILGLFIKDEKIKLFGLILALMQPYSLHFSRVALETHLSACFYTWGIYFYLTNRRKFKISFFIFYILFFILSIYSYHGARVAVPLFIILMQIDPINWLLGKKENKNKKRITWMNISSLILILLCYIPIFLDSNSSSVLTRFNQENFFKAYYPYSPKEILFFPFSKIYYFLGMLTGRLWAYFSPINLGTRVFLWVRRSVMYIPSFGMLGWIESITFLVGIVILIKNIVKEKYRTLLYWIVAGLAPAAATWNWYHPLRSLNSIGAIKILSFLGLFYIFKKNRIIKFLLIFFLIFQFCFIINNEISYSYYETHGEFQPGGFEEGANLISEVIDDYDQVIIDIPQAQSYIFILYYFKINPIIPQKEGYKRISSDKHGIWNFDFGKFKFRKVNWDEDKNLKKTILWTSPRIDTLDVSRIVDAENYFTQSPIKIYQSSQIIFLK
jgi:4-amino-4-deoxy-L-arabinose transferase-like glycosyltransferase